MGKTTRLTESDLVDMMNFSEAHLKASCYMFFVHPFAKAIALVKARTGRS